MLFRSILVSLACFTSVAMADHSLMSAMEDNSDLFNGVVSVVRAKGVICDFENSNQMSVAGTPTSSAFRQVALCFRNTDDLHRARAYLTSGNTLGFYGVPGVEAILDVSYEWIMTDEYWGAGKLLSLSLK